MHEKSYVARAFTSGLPYVGGFDVVVLSIESPVFFRDGCPLKNVSMRVGGLY